MSLAVGLIILGLFLVVLIGVTIQDARDLKSGKDSFLRKTGRWLKEAVDLLFGLG